FVHVFTGFVRGVRRDDSCRRAERFRAAIGAFFGSRATFAFHGDGFGDWTRVVGGNSAVGGVYRQIAVVHRGISGAALFFGGSFDYRGGDLDLLLLRLDEDRAFSDLERERKERRRAGGERVAAAGKIGRAHV